MNLEQLHTFLSVAETGNFNRTAERLAITQAAVSSRIRHLEEELGTTLFDRGRFGATLTPAGRRFQSYASGIVQRWIQARQDIALPPGCEGVVRLATQVSLWDKFITSWNLWMRSRHPNIALHLEAYYSPAMLEMLEEGELDIAVMYHPKTTSDLMVENLFAERFVMISSLTTTLEHVDPGSYIFIDWSPFFQERHRNFLPHLHNATMTMGLGVMALQFLKLQGGTAYYPERTAKEMISDHGFAIVEDAPVIDQQVYTVFPAARQDSPIIQTALEGLRQTAAITE